MDIRRIIIEAMRQQGMSQRRLAGQAGLTQPRISDYLLGKRDVQGETLNKLLEALDLEIRPKKGH